jgi:hypothetical protein
LLTQRSRGVYFQYQLSREFRRLLRAEEIYGMENSEAVVVSHFMHFLIVASVKYRPSAVAILLSRGMKFHRFKFTFYLFNLNTFYSLELYKSSIAL